MQKTFTHGTIKTTKEYIFQRSGSGMKNQKILVINSNGSKWYGQQPDTIEDLLNVLENHPLDPMFEEYGNFISEYKPLKITDENKHLLGCVSFFGNFLTLSHVFNIVTNDEEVINKLATAIRNNQQRRGYKEAKIQYLAQKKLDEIAKQKFQNNEISLKELYEYKNINSEHGKMILNKSSRK